MANKETWYKVRANSKHMKSIIDNATNIIYHGQKNLTSTKESLKSAMIYLGCDGFEQLRYRGQGHYTFVSYTYSYSFDSITVQEWEGK